MLIVSLRANLFKFTYTTSLLILITFINNNNNKIIKLSDKPEKVIQRNHSLYLLFRMYDLFYKYLIFTQVLMVQNFVIHSINGNNELSCVYG